MKPALLLALALLPLAARATPPLPPLDAATLDYLAEWASEPHTPAPDDPLLAALDALIQAPAEPTDPAARRTP